MTDDSFYFSGDTYDHERDSVRLTRQWKDVWRFMLDGKWHTLRGISTATGHPEASVSARLRDFRKKRFGGHRVERTYLYDGLWQYRLDVNRRIDVVLEDPVDATP